MYSTSCESDIPVQYLHELGAAGFANAEDWVTCGVKAGVFRIFLMVCLDSTNNRNQTFPLIDLLPSIIVNAFGLLFPFSLAYNILFVLSLALCAWVMRWLPVRSSEETSVDILRIVLMLSSPIMWGSLNSGLTEDGVFFTCDGDCRSQSSSCSPGRFMGSLGCILGLVLGWMSAVLISVYGLCMPHRNVVV